MKTGATSRTGIKPCAIFEDQRGLLCWSFPSIKSEKKIVQGAWLSFADAHKPKGQMFLGVIIVKADDPNAAVERVIELGLWPHDIPGLDVEILPGGLERLQAGGDRPDA
jgi:hypothetical protein